MFKKKQLFFCFKIFTRIPLSILSLLSIGLLIFSFITIINVISIEEKVIELEQSKLTRDFNEGKISKSTLIDNLKKIENNKNSEIGLWPLWFFVSFFGCIIFPILLSNCKGYWRLNFKFNIYYFDFLYKKKEREEELRQKEKISLNMLKNLGVQL